MINWVQGQQTAAHGSTLPFAALNGALAADVACVVVPAGLHVQQPLHVLYLSTGTLCLQANPHFVSTPLLGTPLLLKVLASYDCVHISMHPFTRHMVHCLACCTADETCCFCCSWAHGHWLAVLSILSPIGWSHKFVANYRSHIICNSN